MAEQFSKITAFKPKENAVRHEVERADEAKKNVMKVALALVKLFPDEAATKVKWAAFLEDMKKVNDGVVLREAEKELREGSKGLENRA